MMKRKNYRRHLRGKVVPIKVAQIIIVVLQANEIVQLTSLRWLGPVETTRMEIKEVEMMMMMTTMIKIKILAKEIRGNLAMKYPLKRRKMKERRAEMMKRSNNNHHHNHHNKSRRRRKKIKHSRIIN